MKILITGSAGFIGFSYANYLCKNYKNIQVVGIDNINTYYSKKYKTKRLNYLKKYSNFTFKKLDLNNSKSLDLIFKKFKFDIVYNFAAQAGVRFSILEPKKYIDSNVVGYFNILELVKKYKVKKLFYASSSSIYGEQRIFPTKETSQIQPSNVYSLSKNFNESLTHIYSKLNKINAVGLRFFTVYGKWGRPDMFLFKLFSSIINKQTFYLNNSGNHLRDFTYIEDVNIILDRLRKKNILKKHVIFNICSGETINIKNIVKHFKKFHKVKIKNVSKHSADLLKTHGSNKKLLKYIGNFKFQKLKNVIGLIFEWYKYNEINKI